MNNLALLGIFLIPCISFATDQSPYAGQDLRPIKSLSEREISSLSAGSGMGFAKLAELNHYPGPKHVLALSDELGLSPLQIAETEALYEKMHQDAVVLGKKLMAAEASLDHNFEDESVNPKTLETALLEIGKIRARLRFVHLEAHLRQKQLLNAKQISKYDRVRGYHGATQTQD